MFDGLVFRPDYKPGDVLTTMDALEAHTLRRAGIGQRALRHAIDQALAQLLADPDTFGEVRVALSVRRKVNKDGVVGVAAVHVDLPKEILEWP